ncbi:TIGR02281 family clan AA aspartic protease [Novosphingobium sp.]|uniref:retropepsin-like aspartic protease family protein n=1 Tax=Novosphingobium sp. TaxID=1874826 RepID=UPI00286A2191|nr:TIGR02281 family clan AA aspartic protease [Novosphingobium sp.]
MLNRLHVISLTAVGSMSLAAAMITPHTGKKPVPVINAPSETPTQEMIGTGREMLLKADAAGQFHIEAQINSAPVSFLIDTGANMVALTEAQAAELGLMMMPDDFQPNMQTASGVGYSAPVHLDRIEFGGFELRDVEAVVVRDLPINLLGQSVLKQLGSVEMQGDTMVLRPK